MGDKRKLLEVKYRRKAFRFSKKTEKRILGKSLQRKHKKTKRWIIEKGRKKRDSNIERKEQKIRRHS